MRCGTTRCFRSGGKELASALRGMASRFDELWAADRFTEIMTLMDDVRPTVDAFFDGVMVMAEDETLRENRLKAEAERLSSSKWYSMRRKRCACLSLIQR
mgnify:CR=1 FL=1